MKRVLRFTASWCSPCKALAKQLEEMQLDIPIEVVDIDASPNVAMEYGIRSVPTLIILDGNIEVKRRTGIVAKDILEDWLSND